MTSSEITEALERHTERLMDLPNVVSVGVGEKDSRPAIVVGVVEQVPEEDLPPGARVPHTLEGHPVVVQTIGSPEIQHSEEHEDG